MKQGWRWYGDRDAITLKEIRQAGVTDVVAAMYERKPGEVWTVEEISAQRLRSYLYISTNPHFSHNLFSTPANAGMMATVRTTITFRLWLRGYRD